MAEPAPGEFLRTVARSGLLTAEELAAVPPAATARAAADHLVAAEKLTHFQAEKLLRGRSQGYFVGPYVVLAPVGRGGMGAVYLARRRDRTGGLLALKILSP